jgi:tetratricopeptide (TPR) repeat protein
MDSFQKLKLDEMFFEADQLIAEKRFADAINTLESILIEAPDYGQAYNHLGWIYETKYKDIKKAEEFYKKFVLYAPDYPAIYINLAVVLSSAAKYDELEAHLTKALQVTGVDKASMYNEFGIMYELQGKYNQSIESYKNAVRHSLSDANIETYAKSIKRCKNKMEIL